MIMFECSGPFQWRPSYKKFGDFRRAMWGWFAVTVYRGGGINELIEGIGYAGAALYADGETAILDRRSP